MPWACFDNTLFFTEIIWTGVWGALHWSEGLQAETEGMCLFIRRCSRSISFYLHHTPHANIKLYKDDMLGLIRDPFLTQHSFCTTSQGNQSGWENQSKQWVKHGFSEQVSCFPLPSLLLITYWVGQKVHSGSSIWCYGKTQMNILAKPIVIGKFFKVVFKFSPLLNGDNDVIFF